MAKMSEPLVLVVDDEPKNLQLIGSLLRERGYDFAYASSGAQALEAVRNDPPDLILLDIMMPEMDGFEVCKRLKQDMATASIPIIFLTAKKETEDIVHGFHVGGVDYVTKPFQPEELLARVATHIQLHQLQGLLPICSYCKKIRNDKNYWEQIEDYIQKNTGVYFSHGICPECYEKIIAEQGWDKK